MAFALSARAREAGYRLEAHETIGSTNTAALEAARRGDLGGLWIVAREQTTGRGRRGSAWSTAAGNLAASCLTVSPRPPSRMATLGFVAGLALHDALCEVVPDSLPAGEHRPRVSFGLKWPNDVLADGAKLSGILLEAENLPSGAHALVVGIGVNVGAAPEGLPYAAASLRSLGSDCTPETLFEALSAHWCRYEEVWAGGEGVAAIRDAWLERAVGLGGPVAVRLGDEVTRGSFETIDEDCRMVVATQGGNRVHVSAGDVHFGTAATHRAENAPEEQT